MGENILLLRRFELALIESNEAINSLRTPCTRRILNECFSRSYTPCLKKLSYLIYGMIIRQGLDMQGQGQGLDLQGPGQGQDLNLVLKESLRTRTRTRTSLTVTYCKLQLNLQSLSSNNNENKVKIHNI